MCDWNKSLKESSVFKRDGRLFVCSFIRNFMLKSQEYSVLHWFDRSEETSKV